MTHLTEREREIVHLLGNGLCSNDIASRLDVAPATVRKHRNNISKKLHLRDTAKLNAYCVAERIRRSVAPSPSLALPASAASAAFNASRASDVPSACVSSAAHVPDDLCRREMQVLRLVARGLTTKEIARMLRLSPRTVSKHRERLMRKCQVHRMVELMRLYRRAATFTPC